ncbi:TPA: AAA family ATPase [Vibrio parahaemolyticus]|nr:AAA family ATPase [Vibrio parahaemolyticus]
MSKELNEIAKDLKKANKKVQLIYAFNGTGKTRLSRAFKELVTSKDGTQEEGDGEAGQQAPLSRHKILYYNAFTEDLFYWDNDLEGDAEPKLRIQPNTFTDWILKVQGQEANITKIFQRYSNDKLTPNFSQDFSHVTFSFERGNAEKEPNVKISKGEESNFVWSIFHGLLEQVIRVLNNPEEEDGDDFQQLEYVFIDDPVSSLDENHLIELAVNLAELIRTSPDKLKFVISTHNPLFYNVLHNELNKKTCYLLQKFEDGSFELKEKQGGANTSFSYHLYIKQLIEKAISDNEVQRFHFNLLRNLYEKVAAFLGYSDWTALLPENRELYAKRVMHFYSHRSLSNEEVAEPTEPEKQTVKFLLEHLLNNYGFKLQGEANA